MAIDFVKRQAVAIASSKLQKVAGNLPGLLGINKGKIGKNSSDTSPLNQKSQNAPKMFQFPLDVAGDPGIGNHGHYILFFVNEQPKSKLSFADELKESNDLINKEKNDRNIPNYINQFTNGKYQKVKNTQGVTSQLIDTGASASAGYLGGENFNVLSSLTAEGMGVPVGKTSSKVTKKAKKAGGQNIRVKRPATKRLDTAIALYMPQQVQTTYGAKYLDAEISSIAAAGGKVSDMIKQGTTELATIGQAIQGNLTDELGKKVTLKLLGALDSVGITGAREAFEISQGEVIADRMELAFKNVERRAFQYTFKMIPKNSREADEIRKIVFAFKANMLPEMAKGFSRDTMKIPNTFNIQYMYKGKENDYIHKVSECFLENVQVTYGGDRYKTFEPHSDDGAPPVETSITLAFKEIEIITRERVFEGF